MQINQTIIFNLNFNSVNLKEALSLLCQEIDRTLSKAKVVVTPNVDHIVKLSNDSNLLTKYSSADFIFADGFPIVLLSGLLNRKLPGRVTGADLFPELCKYAANNRKKVFILGGQPGTDDIIKQQLSELYAGAEFFVYSPSMNFTPDGEESTIALSLIKQQTPDIVFCCIGMPKQELWALNNRQNIHTKLVVCVGAALEFALGYKKRAPLFLQRIGLEWMWRLLSDPMRLWKRYLIYDSKFIALALNEIYLHYFRGR